MNEPKMTISLTAKFICFISFIFNIIRFCLVGEVNAAFGMKSAQFQAKYNRNKPNFSDEIIFHCKIGKRSENAAIAASKLGYTKYVILTLMLFFYQNLFGNTNLSHFDLC